MAAKTFMTLLSTENYLPGVLVLHQSLLDTGTTYPFTVLLSERIDKNTEDKLQSLNIETLRISPSFNFEEYTDTNTSGATHWNYTFEKLNIFSLKQYDKIVFLDSDMLVLENIDELFEKKHMSAVGPAGGRYPGNESYNGLNSGLLVIKPNIEDFDNLINLVPTVTKERKNSGDQDVIIAHFIEEWRKSEDLHLDDTYNMIFPYLDYYIENFGYTVRKRNSEKNIKIVHFIGGNKPWMTRSDAYGFLKFTYYFIRNRAMKKDKHYKFKNNVMFLYKKYLLRLNLSGRI